MRFGIGISDITPSFPVHMYGFGNRTDTCDAVNDRQTCTAIVLEEESRRMLLVAADIGMFPDDGSVPALQRKLGEIVGCPADNIMLNASHTHGAAMMPNSVLCFFTREDDGAAERYRGFLYARVAEAAHAAKANLAEGSLWYGEGTTDFPVNRRRPVSDGIVLAPNPGGPTDNRLQLLVLKNTAGEIAALGVRVACHPVTTGAQHTLTSDYPGAWRQAVRQAFGGQVIPFFLQGAAGDTNPRHFGVRGKITPQPFSALPAMGWELCAQTLQALTAKPLTPITNLVLQGKINQVSAPCERRYTSRADFLALLESKDKWEKMYAGECLRRLDAGEAIPDEVEFTVQTIWMNQEFALIGLDAEPLHLIGHALEDALAPAQSVMLGYTNGCQGYAPDSASIPHGGYETTSYILSVWTGPLKPGLEKLFAGALDKGKM